MEYLKYTEFRNHAKKYFDIIEQGSSFIIVRKDKPIARIIPFQENHTGWKRDNTKIKLKKGKTALDYVLEERNK